LHNRDHPHQRIHSVVPTALIAVLLASLACNAQAQSVEMRPTATHWPTLSQESIAQTQSATPVIGPTATPQTYIVKPGDTANAIAAKFDVTLEQLLFANELQVTDPLIPGRVLTIPQGDVAVGSLPAIGGSPTPLPTAATQEANPLTPYSIDTLTMRPYDGGQIERVHLARADAYDQYAITYTSDGLRVTGLMNIPISGKGPFPVILMLHGGIDQETYKPGDDTAGPADFFAR
jgi:LysM repeat protein